MKEAESHISLKLRRRASRSKGLETSPAGWLRFKVHNQSRITVHILEQFYATSFNVHMFVHIHMIGLPTSVNQFVATHKNPT